MAFRNSGSIDTSIDQMDSSIEMRSPSSPVCTIQPRKLRFASPSRDDDEEEETSTEETTVIGGKQKISLRRNILESDTTTTTTTQRTHTPTTMSISPPYRKVRALRLFDTPATPKTILEKSSGKCLNHLSAVAAADATKRQESLFIKTVERPRSLPLHNRALDNVMQQQTANVNPFTPDSKF